jgi:signal transduction histidine kinase/CheY-like chemotaxis protein/HAMP domain-containing protein
VDQEAQLPTLIEYLSLPAAERAGSPQELRAMALLTALKNKETRNFASTASYSFIESYSLLDNEGRVVLDTFNSNVGLQLPNPAIFEEAIDRIQPYVSPLQFSRFTNEVSIYFAAPVRTANGRLGVLLVRHNGLALQHLASQNNNLAGADSFPVIFDENGVYLAHGRAPELLYKSVTPLHGLQVTELHEAYRLPFRNTEEIFLNDAALADNLAANRRHFTAGDPSTGSRLNQVAVTNLTTQPWKVAFFQPQGAFLASAAEQSQATLVLAMVIALGVVAMGVTVAQWLAGPITRLTAVADKVAAGDLSARAQVETGGEIGRLALAFNSMTGELTRYVGGLEQRVAERTAELGQRAGQIELINDVGRKVTSVLELDNLLPHIARLIRDTFGYYAVVIFLRDEASGQLVIKAADTTEAGELLGEPVDLTAERPGIVAQAFSSGRPIVVNDTETDARFRYEARLPRTRSELALPLRIGEQVLGVLDLESERENSFQAPYVTVLQTLADQIVIAIHNAELFQVARHAQTEAEEANRLKSQFLANMSHELRTPLNSIINFAYLLTVGVEGPLTAGQEDMLRRIGDSGRHLLDLINDILDLAKIESGRVELFVEELDLRDLILSVLSVAGGLLRDKPVELHRDISDDLPLVRVDRTRVRQVLLNLVSNAAKFTEQGQITVRAWGEEDWVTVSVEDTGIGLAAADIPKAFAEFVQVDGHMGRRAGGTGLGLPISKRFVELHGGRIWVESEPGVGSTFYFTLPAVDSPPARDEMGQLEPLEARVLVIDDDPVARETVARQLSHGYRVMRLSDGRRALEVVRDKRPDVIVLDILMPHQDGWEILEALKSDPETKDIPVVVCSMVREEQLALTMGATDFISKPVDPGQLRRIIEQWAPPGGRVLAVDDDPNALEIVTRMLDGLTYHVLTAQDGWSGLTLAREQTPDVVVLDLMMPGLTGLEVLSQMRADPRLAETPVLVVTAKDLTNAERAQLQSEAAVLLQKGQFTADEFNQAIRRAISRAAPGVASG